MTQTNIIETKKIEKITSDSIINLILNTIKQDKQILIFNNSKRSSEATAEKIADKISFPRNKEELNKIADKILKSLSNPTKQCKRLAKCIEKGIGFHHSGLISSQRELVEKGFKQGFIKAISSTPTLAAGLNLPAYKVIIKDYKRYSQRGFNDIPVLEYHQMAGRAGRPGKEKIGRTVLCINNSVEKERVISKYIFGKPEEIISKLAVEPTLKMYILSLISMDLINTKKEIKNFFSNTLYAEQYQDLEALNFNIFRIIDILIDYEFINQDDDYYMATKLGKKISELYLNPDSANYFLEHLDKFVKEFSLNNNLKYSTYSLIHFITKTSEFRPLFRVSKAEEEHYSNKLENVQEFLEIKYDPFEDDFMQYISSLKTTDILIDWISEAPEDFICDKYKITPGELKYKIDTIDWLLYSIEEIAKMKKEIYFKNKINQLRIRFKYGIKEELIELIKLKGIGRVRTRKLYKHNIKTIYDLQNKNIDELKTIIPENIAKNIKEELKTNIIEIKKEEDKTPNELKNRTLNDVSETEIIDLVENYNSFEKEKQEKQLKLLEYF